MYAIRSYYALYKALGGFATNGVNITKLESYITGERFSVARFYAEIEGHPADVPHPDKEVPVGGIMQGVITSYSIHYTKLYDFSRLTPSGC